MNIAVVAITRGGLALGRKLAAALDRATLLEKREQVKTADLLRDNWHRFDGFICIMAAGIVVRSIAPLLEHKKTDPGVVVIDEKGKNVISLLSGHLGGANDLTRRVAAILGANPVITTASDTLELAALDLWARDCNLVPPAPRILTTLSAKLVNSGSLKFYSDKEFGSTPEGLERVLTLSEADFAISNRVYGDSDLPFFRPRDLVVGTGCNRNTPASEFKQALDELFSELGLAPGSIRNLASIDKKNDEEGLLKFATDNGWTIDFFTSDEINSLKNLEISFAALKAVGAIGVAEPACLLSAKSHLLLSRKRKWKNITMAVAQVPSTW
ncbi:cobalt-precorrin 5A hydrolase [Desulforhopalus singaporensis]|uniref:Cobalt-precorrin 5A acetaldehyde-lyase n=1 Tax=Desulforhopalus singaporensis TaxID=91360 RepID=A0A1H0NWE1_9BACT|nr:cobalamin biosynthesis protein [Desulforhopalus singaporensis]SDO97097.1 cobalt-precorrin 5A acetaldehyde-lyase [Desulforhopalus singaporensis]